MTNPLVSIIIPTFNRETLLSETLDSVLNQTYQYWECIVVDDGSSDNTKKIVNKYLVSDKRFIFAERQRKPKGANTCRNIGIEKAKGNYVIFLDSDDLLRNFCLSSRISEISMNPDYYAWIFQRENLIHDSGEIVKNNVILNNNIVENFFKLNPPWQTTSSILKIDIIKKINGFDEKLPRLQDVDFYVRLIREISLEKFKISNKRADFLRRKFHYDDFSSEIKLKNRLGIWYFLKKNTSYIVEFSMLEKKALKLLFKRLVFDYLSNETRNYNKIKCFSEVLYSLSLLNRKELFFLYIYACVVRFNLHRVNGMKRFFSVIIF